MFGEEEFRCVPCGEDAAGLLWHVCRIDMILARRALLFADVHKVSTTLWAMTRVIAGATTSELIRDIVAGRIVFHR